MSQSSIYLDLPDFSFDPTAVIIFGAGGHGKTLVELIKSGHTFHVIGLIDDHLEPGYRVAGIPVLGTSAILSECYEHGIHLAVNGVGGIGNIEPRLQVFDILAKNNFVCPAVIHPTAWVEESAILEPGVQILAHSYVGSSARVGFGSVLNVGVCFSHDVVVGKVNNFSPGAMLGGDVVVGDYSQVGMNATINRGVKLGSRVRIGNGATIKKDVADDVRVPAGAVYPPAKTAVSQ